MTTPTDEELLVASGRGDRDAFALLVQRHQRAIVHFVHRFLATADRATAEDLAQEVFLSGWKYAASFEPRASVRTWLFRVAANACLNYRRHTRSRIPTVPLGQELEETREGGAAGVDSRILAEERAQRMRAALAGLPPKQRAAIVLRHFHGLSYEEIADILEATTSAVDSLLHRARGRLHETLGAKKKTENSPQVLAVRRAQLKRKE